MKKSPPIASSTFTSLQYQPGELLQHISDALVATDMNFNVVFFNAAAERIYGIASSKILDKPLGSFIRYTYHDTTVEKCLDDLNREGHCHSFAVIFIYNSPKLLQTHPSSAG